MCSLQRMGSRGSYFTCEGLTLHTKVTAYLLYSVWGVEGLRTFYDDKFVMRDFKVPVLQVGGVRFGKVNGKYRKAGVNPLASR